MTICSQGSVEPIYRCTSCGGVYAEKVTQCDCMPKVQEFFEGTMTFAEPFAVDENDVTGKWCYSADGESYRGQFASEKEAQGAAIDYLDGDGEEGDEVSFWIARCCHPLDVIDHDKRLLWTGERMLEQVDEWCADEVASEDAIFSMTYEDHVALGKLVFDFIRSRAKVQYYGITDPVKHKHVLGSN